MMMWLLLFSLQSFAAAPFVSFDEAALRARFDQPVLNDGPNCYNTAFVSMGYLPDIVHTSTDEAIYYFHNFCQEQKGVKAEGAQNGALIAYHSADSKLVHVAVALGGGNVLEKYNYLGLHADSFHRNEEAGRYLFQNLRSSYYFQSYSAQRTKVYHCVTATELQQRLAAVLVSPQTQQLNKIRATVAAELEKMKPAELDIFLQSTATPALKDLESILRNPPESEAAKKYDRVLATSLLHQFYYMLDNSSYSCESCTRQITRPLQDQITKLQALIAKNY